MTLESIERVMNQEFGMYEGDNAYQKSGVAWCISDISTEGEGK